MKILLMILILTFSRQSFADVRRIEIPIGHIADDFTTSESYIEKDTGISSGCTGFNNKLETGEILFYPHLSKYANVAPPNASGEIVLSGDVCDIPFGRVIMLRQTGSEWYDMSAAGSLTGVSDQRIDGKVPQFFAGQPVLIRMDNPLAYENMGFNYPFNIFDATYGWKSSTNYFYSPRQVFWKSIADASGNVKIAYNFDVNNRSMGFDEYTNWNETDAPSVNTYPYWAYVPMKIPSQHVHNSYYTNPPYTPFPAPAGFTVDHQWDTLGYSDMISRARFYCTLKDLNRGLDRAERWVPGLGTQWSGYQLKILSRFKGYADYGVLDMILAAPRPKGLVRWLNVNISHAVTSFSGSKEWFGSDEVFYNELCAASTSRTEREKYVGPLTAGQAEMACLFPQMNTYSNPSNEYLMFDP
ncbi:MAG: hypothetical protein PHW04_13835, partial [Candidatus Wallbacteria bacterium]|nr:hypothetical protein [Candidatus Wallbacteria bacterium]